MTGARRSRFRRLAARLAASLLLLGMGCGRHAPDSPADLVLRGGAVYTLDASRRWAQAVAVREGRIVFVGGAADVERWIGPATRVIELDPGTMVLPGFHDSHAHPVTGGIDLALCGLHDRVTQAQVVEAIRACAEDQRGRDWIVGAGWQLPVFPGANPGRELLDRIVPDRPVFLTAADGHSAWVNSRALEIAGIDSATPDPPDGRIERDARSGEPTGTLREAATALVERHVPQPTDQERREGLRRALEMANRFGITSLVEASADEPILAAYFDADRGGTLTARVRASQRIDPRRGPEQVVELAERRDRFGGGRLRADAAKVLLDGVIEGHTAALLEPYLDRPGERGAASVEPARLDSLVRALEAEGFQLHLHAIGDRAVRTGLDAFEAALRAGGPDDLRHHVAHVQLAHPDDFARFRRLGVIANFQPLWAQADAYITELTEPVLGPARSRWLYPIRSLQQTGAIVVAGSDWPVTSMNPLEAIQVAITREPLDGAGEPWIPEERATLEAMLAAYTINGAYLAHQEQVTGSIEVGKAADLVVLDRNLFDVPPAEIHRARVLLTLLEGEAVYRGPGLRMDGALPAQPAAAGSR